MCQLLTIQSNWGSVCEYSLNNPEYLGKANCIGHSEKYIIMEDIVNKRKKIFKENMSL